MGDPGHNLTTRFALYDFNRRVPTNIVPYGGTRPVNIYPLKGVVKIIHPSALGVAYPGLNSCDIYMNMEELTNYKIFKNTLVHEYLHCLGYNHVDNPNDLMYYVDTDHDDSEITKWAKKIEEEIFK